MAIDDGAQQGGCAVRVAKIRISALGEQRLHSRDMSADCGRHQRRRAFAGGSVHIRALVEQEPDDLCLAAGGRQDQDRGVVTIALLHAGAPAQQNPADFHVARKGACQERRHPVLVPGVHLRPAIDERTDLRRIALSRGADEVHIQSARHRIDTNGIVTRNGVPPGRRRV
jgi:hypothetical protein